MLVLDCDFVLDDSSIYYQANKKIYDFANDFITIRYLIGNENKIAKVSAIESDKLDKKLVLQTTNEINNASKVDMLITIRNKVFIINLVSK